MKTWTKVAVVVGAVTLVGAGGAFAFGRGIGGPRFMKHMIQMRVEAAEDLIQATDAQRQVIDASASAIIGKLEARMASHQGEREQWAALFLADKLDAATVYAKVDAKADEAKAVAREIVPELIKVHDVLTADQRKTLAEHARKMHGRHGPGGFGGHGGHGPGGFGGDEE